MCQQSTWWHCLLALWLLTFGETPGRSNRRLGLGETVAKADFLFVRINSSMSAIGTKRTCTGAPRMSAFGSKPDIGNYLPITPLTLIGMSYALRHGEHVRVDVLFANFKDRTKHAINALSAAIAMIFSALVIWLSFAFVAQSWAMGEDGDLAE